MSEEIQMFTNSENRVWGFGELNSLNARIEKLERQLQPALDAEANDAMNLPYDLTCPACTRHRDKAEQRIRELEAEREHADALMFEAIDMRKAAEAREQALREYIAQMLTHTCH